MRLAPRSSSWTRASLLSLITLLLGGVPVASAQPAARLEYVLRRSLSVDGKPVQVMALDAAGKTAAAVTLDARHQAELFVFDTALGTRRRVDVGLGTVTTVWGVHFGGPFAYATKPELYVSYDRNKYEVYHLPSLEPAFDESSVDRTIGRDPVDSSAVGLATLRSGIWGGYFCTSSPTTVVLRRVETLRVVTQESVRGVRMIGCGFAQGYLVVVDAARIFLTSLSVNDKRTAAMPDPILAMAVSPAGDVMAVTTAAYVQTNSLPGLRPLIRFRHAVAITAPVRLAYLLGGKLLLVGRSGVSVIHQASTGAPITTVKDVQRVPFLQDFRNSDPAYLSVSVSFALRRHEVSDVEPSVLFYGSPRR